MARLVTRPGTPQRGVEHRLREVELVFAALAHPSRRHVLLLLQFRGGEMTAGEIAERLACRWPTTSRHLRVLESSGLVSVEAQGRERLYRLERERLLAVTGQWLRWFDVELSEDELEEDAPGRPV